MSKENETSIPCAVALNAIICFIAIIILIIGSIFIGEPDTHQTGIILLAISLSVIACQLCFCILSFCALTMFVKNVEN